MESRIAVDGAELDATSTLPPGPCRAGVVVLHGAGAEAGERHWFLYEHLARLLGARGVAVLRYDRRRSIDGHDVPLEVQASDALAAARWLRDELGVPVGLWGFSQGAWAAALAAAAHPADVAYLICVSLSGVSPAEQMRAGCTAQLLAHGFSGRDVEDMLALRLAVEGFTRGERPREDVQAIVDDAADRPWFPYAHVRRELPRVPGSWRDMDFDPRPVLDRLACPALAFYGETDAWVPLAESLAAWRSARSRGQLRDLTVVRLPGADHLPTLGGVPDAEAIVPEYTAALGGWIDAHVGGASAARR